MWLKLIKMISKLLCLYFRTDCSRMEEKRGQQYGKDTE